MLQTRLLLFSAFALTVHTIHLSPIQDIGEDFRNRVFSGATTAPIREGFSAVEGGNDALRAVVRHFQRIEGRLKELIAQRKPYGKSSDDYLCNRKQGFALEAFQVKLRTLGLPPATSTCVTEVVLDQNTTEHAWHDKWAFINASRAAGRRAVAEMKPDGWTDAYTHANFTYRDLTDCCEVLHTVGFRWQGVWTVMVSVTQYPVSFPKRNFGRQYFVEYIDGELQSRTMRLPRWPDAANIVPNTTTTRENWRGTPASSIFRTVLPLNDNPAVAAALYSTEGWREQAQDMTVVSNISVMLLSSLFSLVPLAIIADVGVVSAFLYTVLTDIVACMPLAIKGIELMSRNINAQADVAWAYGWPYPLKSTLVIESWTGRCIASNSVRMTGIALLSASIFLMAIGVLLEIWARARLRENKLQASIMRYHLVNTEFLQDN